MEISPLIVQLGPTTPIATLRVRSESGGIWEVAPVTWSQAAGEDVYGPTSELIVTPPIFELKPGQEQLVRVGMLALGQEAAERAFRLFLREVPVRQGTGIGLRLRV